jgi:predicted AlkP superfamily phosphohydrolase/phosphomutase
MSWFNILKQKTPFLEILEETVALYPNELYQNDAKILHDLILQGDNWKQTIENKYEDKAPLLISIGEGVIAGKHLDQYEENYDDTTLTLPYQINNDPRKWADLYNVRTKERYGK